MRLGFGFQTWGNFIKYFLQITDYFKKKHLFSI
uniref:Uncharacterized protein n=1 Tax=Anguilla anguilla TaxID=7936 RepID=A0A0E9W6U5_ANGAN